jgi:hypothetical protein
LKSDRLLVVAMTLILGFGLASFFLHPKQSQQELVTPQQELDTYQARYPGDPGLANRLLKSYELAFILVRSPYVNNNLNALEAIREWAREQFQLHPDFLHPVALSAPSEKRDTVFGALGYSLFAAPKYWMEEQVGQLMRLQIAAFHQTGAYRSFNNSFFSMFGKDADAASLLARYETDRAKQAITVVLWSLIWFAAALAGIRTLIANRGRDFFDALRRTTAAAWALLSLSYLSQTWATGHAADLLSTLLSAGISLFVYRPFLLVSHHEAKQQLVRIRLAPCWIATAAWFTFTCICVQILTWMHTGIQAAPDPVSLFLSSLTGNFLHDPIYGKRIVTDIIAGTWIICSLWALRQRHNDQPFATEPDANFETLNESIAYDHIG